MGKKIEKEKDEIVEEFFRRNDPKNIKSMNDMYTAWKDFFAPAFQQLLDAEMEAKIGYSKNERTDNNNYRNGYYPERTVATKKVLYLSTLKAEKNGQEWLINGIYAYLNLELCMKAEYKIKPKNNRLKKNFS